MSFPTIHYCPNPPTWVASGAIAAVTGGAGTLPIPYPSPGNIQAGDTLVIQMGIRQYDGHSELLSASGWGIAFGPQTEGNATQILWCLSDHATGGESGSVSFTIGTSGTPSNMLCGIMHVFRKCHSNALINNGQPGTENDSPSSSASGACPGPSVTTTRPGRLVAAFAANCASGGVDLGAPAGWTQRAHGETTVGGDFGLDLVTKSMPQPASISGGTFNTAGSDPTVVRAFSIPGI